MNSTKLKQWLKAAGIRALKTAAQTVAAMLGTATAGDIDLKAVISASFLAGILSMLTSTAGLPEIKE